MSSSESKNHSVSGVGDTRRFDRFYHVWNRIHAAVVTLLVIGAETAALKRVSLLILAAWIPVALLALIFTAGRLHPDGAGHRIPNLLTSVRVVAATGLGVILTICSFNPGVREMLLGQWGYVLVGVLLLVEVTDFFDGYLARRLPTGRFGATWDMESDAIFALALAVAVRHIHGTWFHVLVIGLMRYLFVLFTRFDSDPVVCPPAYKLYAKTVAAIITSSLLAGLVPFIGPAVRTIGFAIVLALQLSSFAWDLLLRRKPRNAAERPA